MTLRILDFSNWPRRWKRVLPVIVIGLSLALWLLLSHTANNARGAGVAESKIGLLRQAPDGLGSASSGLIGAFAKRLGVDPSAAHSADTGSSGWRVWLAENTAQVCLFGARSDESNAIAQCGSQDDTAAGRLGETWTGAGSSPPVTVIGVVPDGVSSVTIASASGAATASVKDNVFVGSANDHATAYTYAAPDGTHTVPITIGR